jgi:hypothetical protein
LYGGIASLSRVSNSDKFAVDPLLSLSSTSNKPRVCICAKPFYLPLQLVQNGLDGQGRIERPVGDGAVTKTEELVMPLTLKSAQSVVAFG